MRPRRPAWPLVLSLGALLAMPVAALAGSTSYQGNPAHDGAVDDAALRPPLTRAWTRDLDATPGFPLAVDGRVFVIAGETLYALDRANGATLWRRPVAAREDQLAYDGGRLYVINGELAQAIDPTTGASLWRVRALPSSDFFSSIPVAAGGRLYSTVGSAVRAVSGADGATLWRTGTYRAAGLLTVAGDRVLASSEQQVAGLDLGGAVKWETQADYYAGGKGFSVLHAGRVWTNHGEVRDAATGTKLRDYSSAKPPAFAGTAAVLVQGGALVTRDEASDATLWTYAPDGGVVSPPFVAGGAVYAATGAGHVVAVDAVTGAPLGSVALDGTYARGDDEYEATGLAGADGMLIVPLRNGISGYLGAGAAAGTPRSPVATEGFGTPSGATDDARAAQQNPAHSGAANATVTAPLRRRWSIEARMPTRALIADGKVFAITADGTVYHVRALDARDGSELWRVRIPQELSFPDPVDAAYDAGRVFVVGAGRLRTFDAATGDLLWASGDGVTTAPIAFNGVVYAGTESRMRGYRESDGAIVRDIDSGGGGAPASDGRTLWWSLACGGWGGIDLATGEHLGSRPVECASFSSFQPLSIGDGVIASSDASVVADSRTGEAVDALGSHVVPALAGGMRFSLTELALENKGFSPAQALDAGPARGGPLRWRFYGDGSLSTPPLVVGRQVFIASSGGRLYALDADSGAKVWSASGDELYGPTGMAAGEGLLVVPARKRLVAWESGGAPGGSDVGAPQTRLAPIPAQVSERDPLVSFSSDQDGFFECRLDDGAWTPCTSPHRLVGIGDYTHTFRVRAIDVDGNVDPSPAAADFRVDAAPDTSISADSSRSNRPQPQFGLYARNPETTSSQDATFECRLDGSAWAPCDDYYQPPAPLADGDHWFEARATDTTGHTDPTPARLEWHLDTVPPSGLTIDSATSEMQPLIAGHAAAGGDAGTWVRVWIQFGANGEGGLEANFDAPIDPATGEWSGRPLDKLDDGTYLIRARQFDTSNNVTEVDRVLVINAVTPETRITSGPEPVSSNREPYFSFSSIQQQSTFECRLDGAVWTACTSHSDWPVSEGVHTFEVRAIAADDGAPDPTPASWTWRVDSTAPAGFDVVLPASPVSDPRPVLHGHGGTALNDAEVSLRVRGNNLSRSASGTVDADGTWSVRLPMLPDGTYAVEGYQYDAAGNYSGSYDWGSFTVAAAYPGTEIRGNGEPPRDVRGDAGFDLSSTAPGARFECRLDDGPWVACASPWALTDLADGEHTVSARSIDTAGHVDQQPASLTFASDGTPPALTLESPADMTVTTDSTPSFSGRAGTAPGDGAVKVGVSGPIGVVATVTTTGASWTAEVTVPLPAGRYRVSATQTDASGNSTNTPERDLFVNVPASPPVTPGEATVSPSPSPSPTPTPTPTPTPSATLTPTPTPSPFATTAPTPTPTPAPASDPPPKLPPLDPETDAEPAAPASPAALSRAVVAALRNDARLPMRFRYRPAHAGRLTVVVRRGRHSAALAVVHARFRAGQERTVTLRGRRLPRELYVEVRFGTDRIARHVTTA